MTQVCLVVGAGAGIGGSVGRRFAAAGYHAVLCRRSDADGLEQLVSEIRSTGGAATGALMNAVEAGTIEDRVAQTEDQIGPIRVAVYNLGAQIGHRPLETISDKVFERCWQLGTNGLFRLAKALCPRMAARGEGTIIVTSATAAVRGNAGQHAHAAAMGGRRMLCQTLNAEYAAHGVHIVHVLIDGAVDAPDTLGKMLGPDAFDALRTQKGDDGLLDPAQIAETYYHLAHQHRSAWTHEADLRAWTDQAWWNSGATR